MLTVVADTNIYISAFAFGGLPERLLRFAERGVFRLAVSAAIQEEIAKVLRGDKFLWPENEVEKAQRQITCFSTNVETGEALDVIVDDPSDNRILECAVAARADAIVTGDKHLLRLGHFGDTPVMKVAEFLQWARGEGSRH